MPIYSLTDIWIHPNTCANQCVLKLDLSGHIQDAFIAYQKLHSDHILVSGLKRASNRNIPHYRRLIHLSCTPNLPANIIIIYTKRHCNNVGTEGHCLRPQAERESLKMPDYIQVHTGVAYISKCSYNKVECNWLKSKLSYLKPI